MFLLAFQEVRLVPDGTMFIHIGLILLMIWVLNRTFFRPINRVIESRERHKGGRSGEAQEILKQVAEKQTHIEAAMLEARSEGYKLIERERDSAIGARQEKIGAVKLEVEQLVAGENQELGKQTAEARAVIAQEAGKMADKISSNILKTA
jgi:F0F1-type ATP synthase membrane subunit b/b'